MPPSILIVDDHQIVRQGVRTLLTEFRPEWQISGEASNAAEALQAIQALKPDLVVLDITMPGTSGLELTAKIRSLGLPSRILIFTMHHSSRIGSDVRAAGAQGYVLKSQAARDLVFAIESILDGGTFYGQESEGGGGSDPSPRRNVFFFSGLRTAWA
jgi:two-component system nitrate/nitrite response regulator NarL